MTEASFLVDSSVWISDAFQDLPPAARARLRSSPTLVSSAALAEVRSVLLRRGIKTDVAGELAARENIVAVGADDGLAGGTLHARLRAQGANVSMVDAIQLATARRLGVKFLTRDRAFPNDRDVEFV